MEKCDVALLGNEVAELREQLEADQRFRKALMGLDPTQVNEYTKAQREFAAQLQAELGESRRRSEEHRADAERLRTALEQREGQLTEADRRLREGETHRRELLAAQRETEGQLNALRESVEKQSLERLRAQLIAATHEGGETAARLAVALQENKQLSARLDTLTAEEKALSAALSAEQERNQTLSLMLERGLAQVKARSQTNARAAALRLRETAEVLAACFAESDALLEHLSHCVPPLFDTDGGERASA